MDTLRTTNDEVRNRSMGVPRRPLRPSDTKQGQQDNSIVSVGLATFQLVLESLSRKQLLLQDRLVGDTFRFAVGCALFLDFGVHLVCIVRFGRKMTFRNGEIYASLAAP
jgi:hypothetical protein